MTLLGSLDGSGDWAGYQSSIARASDYYPFGLTMPNRSIESDGYRYGFNGKEKDTDLTGNAELIALDYGFRIYNPAIGKFLSVDPLTQSYPFYTPYQFAGNKPIWASDKDGLEENPETKTIYNQPNDCHLEIEDAESIELSQENSTANDIFKETKKRNNKRNFLKKVNDASKLTRGALVLHELFVSHEEDQTPFSIYEQAYTQNDLAPGDNPQVDEGYGNNMR